MSCKLFIPALLLALFPVAVEISFAQGTPEIGFKGALYHAVFFPQDQPVAVKTTGLPPATAAIISRFNQRNQAFRARLETPAGMRPGPELWQLQKRQQVERATVAVIEAAGIEQLAADYAKEAIIYYEWEALSENPLEEAAFAENYLAKQPETPLRPYLYLFLAQRYRCAAEIFSREKKPKPGSEAREKYQHYLKLAGMEPDPLIGLIAADLDRQPYLYLAPPPVGPACSEKAIPERIADPRQWSLRCFALSYGPAAGQPETLVEVRQDIDQDQAPELFIGSAVARGNAGGTFYVFKPDGNHYRYLGALFLHPQAFSVLPLTAAGQPQMVRYRRLGPERGSLETIIYQDGEFKCSRSEAIFPTGKDEKRYRELFQKPLQPLQVTPQYPELSIDGALKLAAAYLQERQIDTSGRYLNSIHLEYDDGSREYPNGSRRRGFYWYLHWAWATPRLGDELSLRIFMDKEIILERTGP